MQNCDSEEYKKLTGGAPLVFLLVDGTFPLRGVNKFPVNRQTGSYRSMLNNAAGDPFAFTVGMTAAYKKGRYQTASPLSIAAQIGGGLT
jgi:hypothetical protein